MEIKTINISSSKKIELIDITSNIKKLIENNQLDKGILTLFVPHTTAAVTINENYDPHVGNDLEKAMSSLIPDIDFKHSEGNSPAHFLSTLVGCHEIIPINKGKAELGTWQGIFFCEFDGPRNRKLKIYWHNKNTRC